MSQAKPTLIWYCEEHGHSAYPTAHNCYQAHYLRDIGRCRMVESRLVSPTALVIERDENGEWPIPYVWSDDAQGVIARFLNVEETAALASSQGVEP